MIHRRRKGWSEIQTYLQEKGKMDETPEHRSLYLYLLKKLRAMFVVINMSRCSVLPLVVENQEACNSLLLWRENGLLPEIDESDQTETDNSNPQFIWLL
jgi:hypothetical protein